ncbi:unnamed protein product [Brachionus calyciflorus]|uniref:Uncharacterized protein n=1 Tax=Brachionus calyciflorus TaxID=104777 RepID=A0A813MZW7_9BILA|nr:unnamed protein product [Brachionus calyciflorus]
MFKIIATLTIFLLVSLSFSLITIFSNEWFIIKTKDKLCFNKQISDLNCVMGNQYPSVNYGLFFACPFNSTKLNWILSSDEYCFQFNTQRIAPKNFFLSNYLNDKNLVDLEPNFTPQIQIGFIVGTCFLFVATLVSASSLIYLSIKIDDLNFINSSQEKFDLIYSDHTIVNFGSNQKYNLVKNHLRVIFSFLFVDFLTRFVSFTIFTISSDDYLNYILRKSYSLNFDKDFFSREKDTFVKKILENYRIEKLWSYWFVLISLVLSLIVQITILVYQITNCIISNDRSKRCKLNGSIQRNLMSLSDKDAIQKMTRSNLLSIEPVEIYDDHLIDNYDRKFYKSNKNDMNLFYIDNEYLKYCDDNKKESEEDSGNEPNFRASKILESVRNLENSLLFSSDNQLNYISKLENVINNLNTLSRYDIIGSDSSLKQVSKSSRKSMKELKKFSSGMSLPNLADLTNISLEGSFEKLIIREKIKNK